VAHDLVTELLQYSSLACFMAIWQLCANLLIPNCLRSNLSYSPLAALELYVNVYNSQKSDVMSELALANVEALAESELSQKCGDCSTDKQVYCCTLVIEGLGTFTLNKD
jgi:two-component system sensor histidine kinase/response regulator, hybrid (one-component system)